MSVSCRRVTVVTAVSATFLFILTLAGKTRTNTPSNYLTVSVVWVETKGFVRKQ